MSTTEGVLPRQIKIVVSATANPNVPPPANLMEACYREVAVLEGLQKVYGSWLTSMSNKKS